MSISKTVDFEVPDAGHITASLFGNESDPPVLLLHGAGQTRHSWRSSAIALANSGWQAIAVDTRGHGDSGWSASGNYSIDALINDLKAIIDSLVQKGLSRPVVVGASLGGITALIAQGESVAPVFSALVLVDITPSIDPAGVERILEFMSANDEGFKTIEEAADAVNAYQPHRSRSSPKATTDRHSGLRKNLRLEADGRYYWHWDPRLLDHVRTFDAGLMDRQRAACADFAVPVLLVHGKLSEIVSDETAREFLKLVPSARYVNVSGAAHMVAGDDNDVFAAAVIEFLQDVTIPITPSR